MKICFYALRPFDELQMAEKLSEKTGIEFVYTSEYPNDDNLILAKGCEILSCTPCDINKDRVDRFYELGIRKIATRSIGYDHIDLEECRKLGIEVSNVSYGPEGVANYAIACILMSERRIPQIMKRAMVQDYTLKGKLGRDISSETVGVIGTGRIGTTVIKHLSGFGCKILAYDMYQNEEVKKYATYVSLDELFKNSDVITLHANATEDNHHMINTSSLLKMKDGVLIVNTARGKLIDHEALIQSIKNGKVGGAVLDVLEKEDGLYYMNRVGDVIDNDQMAILNSFPNVTLLPHTAFYTEDDVYHMVLSNFESAIAYRDKKEDHHKIL